MDKYFKLNSTGTHLNCVHRPAFASSVIIELHQDDNNIKNHFVKARYNGEYMKLCEKNSTVCDYVEFKERIVSQFSDFKKECGIQNLLSPLEENMFVVK